MIAYVIEGSVCGSNSSLTAYRLLDTEIYPKILTRP